MEDEIAGQRSCDGAIVMKQFTITKKIAKHGRQAIIVVPKILQAILKPNTLVELQIKVLEEK